MRRPKSPKDLHELASSFGMNEGQEESLRIAFKQQFHFDLEEKEKKDETEAAERTDLRGESTAPFPSFGVVDQFETSRRSVYLSYMNADPIIRPCKTVGSTSRAAGSYKPRKTPD
jgi:hypothetical protein